MTKSNGYLVAALLSAGVFAACTGDAGPQGPAGEPRDLDPSLSTVDKAVIGMGGRAALEGMNGLSYQAAGLRAVVDEGEVVGSSSLDVSTFSVKVNHDIRGDRMRFDYERTFFQFFLQAAPTFSEVISGQRGFIEGNDNSINAPARGMLSDRWAAVRKQHLLLNPQLIVQKVLADPSLASEGGVSLVDGAVHELLVVEDSVFPITLHVSPRTGEIAMLSTMENDHLHRDSALEVVYAGWRAQDDGLKIPTSAILTLNGEFLHHESRSAVAINPTLNDELFALPQQGVPPHDDAAAHFGATTHQFLHQFSSFGIPAEGLHTNVELTELAPGVHHVRGHAWHSLAIEQSDGIVVVEAPLSPERGDAILAALADRFPDKSVTHVIATHHHTDHTAGLRSFVASGAKIVTSSLARRFLARAFDAPSAINPDTLSRAPASADWMTVTPNETLVLPDSERPVEVHPMDTVHAEDMMFVYLPGQEIVFVTDIYNPGPTPEGVADGPRELYDTLVSSGMATPTLTIAGGHGGTGPLAELEAQLGL